MLEFLPVLFFIKKIFVWNTTQDAIHLTLPVAFVTLLLVNVLPRNYI